MSINNSIILCLFLLLSCKSKQLINKENEISYKESVQELKHIGKVTYLFAKDGCGCLIEKKDEKTKDILYLIPLTELDKKLYPEGSIVLFNYTTSKRMQPGNCNKGIPVIINTIELQKK